MSNFLGQFFYVLGGKKNLKIFKKYFSNRIEKLHKMAYIYLFFLKKLKKVEKTGIISTNISQKITSLVTFGSTYIFSSYKKYQQILPVKIVY